MLNETDVYVKIDWESSEWNTWNFRAKDLQMIDSNTEVIIPADKLLSLFSFDGDPELSHLNETGRVPIPLIKDSIETYIVKDVVQIKHGHWVNPHWENSNYCYNCSKCKKEAMHEKYEWAKQGIYPICPNCGARMSVPKD